MDVGISPDGQTLYISRAVFVSGLEAPKKSELMLARLKDGAFSLDPDSAEIMKRINTGALQYAPSIPPTGWSCILRARASSWYASWWRKGIQWMSRSASHAF